MKEALKVESPRRALWNGHHERWALRGHCTFPKPKGKVSMLKSALNLGQLELKPPKALNTGIFTWLAFNKCADNWLFKKNKCQLKRWWNYWKVISNWMSATKFLPGTTNYLHCLECERKGLESGDTAKTTNPIHTNGHFWPNVPFPENARNLRKNRWKPRSCQDTGSSLGVQIHTNTLLLLLLLLLFLHSQLLST